MHMLNFLFKFTEINHLTTLLNIWLD